MAAEQTITVRRHMKRRAPAERERPIKVDEAADRANAPRKNEAGKSAGGEQDEKSAMGVREFIDDAGRPWRAWPVVPGLTKASSSGRQFLGDFQDGWICFEGLGTSARRRLPRRERGWADMTDEELQQLLEQAVDAPVRGTKRQDRA